MYAHTWVRGCHALHSSFSKTTACRTFSQDTLILFWNAPNYIMSAAKCRVVSGIVCGSEVIVVKKCLNSQCWWKLTFTRACCCLSLKVGLTSSSPHQSDLIKKTMCNLTICILSFREFIPCEGSSSRLQLSKVLRNVLLHMCEVWRWELPSGGDWLNQVLSGSGMLVYLHILWLHHTRGLTSMWQQVKKKKNEMSCFGSFWLFSL